MIGHLITKFIESGLDKSLFESMLDMFLELLTYTSGDVSEALSWMTQLDERYGFTNDEYGMGDFIEELKEKGYIDENEEHPGQYIITSKSGQTIRKRSLELTEQIIRRAQEYNFKINSPQNAERRGGTVVVQMENSQQISKELLKRNFLIDWRPNAGIRISPHFYNTKEEADAIMEEMKKLSTDRIRD